MALEQMRKALRKALAPRGMARQVAYSFGITPEAVYQWDIVPPMRVLDVERITGVSKHKLRPDIYPREKRKAQ